jgi:hypothetical protein
MWYFGDTMFDQAPLLFSAFSASSFISFFVILVSITGQRIQIETDGEMDIKVHRHLLAI